jgi:hypothetical protein
MVDLLHSLIFLERRLAIYEGAIMLLEELASNVEKAAG